MHEVSFRAMGCQIVALLDNDHPSAGQRLLALPAQFEAWEQTLSRFRPSSELSRLNARAGQAVPVSPPLWAVLMAARHAAEASQGLVTPTVLPALVAAGYDRSFRHLTLDSGTRGPQAGLTSEVSTRHPCPPWQTIEFDPQMHSVRLPPGTQIDLGGIGKGWAAEQAARLLQPWGPTLVDAGGDIAISAPLADGQHWPIAIANPCQPGQHLAVLHLAQGGVATSGRDERRWQQAGIWQHHLIDPRTGQPAQTDLLSATVIAPSVLKAEMAAKLVLLLGCQPGFDWIEAHPDLAGLLVCENGRVVQSTRLAEYMDDTAGGSP
jgi:thiamine biosynthesis lipoprotein